MAPRQYSVKYGADIYLQSCYGTALRYFILPIGLPTIYSFQLTLGAWLIKNEFNLLNRMAVVQGNLPKFCRTVFSFCCV